MLKAISALCAATLTLAFTGCVGTGPNTEQGAVTGGALGALAGAVIGHNSRGGDAVGGAILGAAAGAIAGGANWKNVGHHRGPIFQPEPLYRGPRMSRGQRHPPPRPPPQAEAMPPAPAPNALWIPGYWNYDGRGYSWAGGHWEIPPPMARSYIAAHWENRGSQYVYVPGYWQ